MLRNKLLFIGVIAFSSIKALWATSESLEDFSFPQSFKGQIAKEIVNISFEDKKNVFKSGSYTYKVDFFDLTSFSMGSVQSFAMEYADSLECIKMYRPDLSDGLSGPLLIVYRILDSTTTPLQEMFIVMRATSLKNFRKLENRLVKELRQLR